MRHSSPVTRCHPISQRTKSARAKLDFVYKHIGYARIMGDRPQALTGLVDSPVGLAAFLLDYDARSLELISREVRAGFRSLR
jgi:hypothetical protein